MSELSHASRPYRVALMTLVLLSAVAIVAFGVAMIIGQSNEKAILLELQDNRKEYMKAHKITHQNQIEIMKELADIEKQMHSPRKESP